MIGFKYFGKEQRAESIFLNFCSLSLSADFLTIKKSVYFSTVCEVTDRQYRARGLAFLHEKYLCLWFLLVHHQLYRHKYLLLLFLLLELCKEQNKTRH